MGINHSALLTYIAGIVSWWITCMLSPNAFWQIFKTPPEDADPSEIRCPLRSASQPVTDKFTPGVNHTSLDVSSQNPQPVYMNKAPSLPPYVHQKPKLRSVEIYNPVTERK